MGTNAAWPVDLHQEYNPDFFSDAQAVELPEPSWHDAENLAAQDDETEQVSDAQPEPFEEVEEQQPEFRAPRFRDAHDHRQQMWAAHDCRMDAELAHGKGKVEYQDKFQCAFHAVVARWISFKYASAVKVQTYSDAGHGHRKAGAPNRIDFVADCELVARRTLKDSPELWRVFQERILENEAETWQEVPVDIRSQIEQKVGRAYIRTGLHPSSRYFA